MCMVSLVPEMVQAYASTNAVSVQPDRIAKFVNKRVIGRRRLPAVFFRHTCRKPSCFKSQYLIRTRGWDGSPSPTGPFGPEMAMAR